MTNTAQAIQITLNGEPHSVAPDLVVSALLQQLTLAPERIAIEYNHKILSRQAWDITNLQNGDKLEIVHFVGGG